MCVCVCGSGGGGASTEPPKLASWLYSFKGDWIHLVDFRSFMYKGDNFLDALICFPAQQHSSEKGFTPKGKNLLTREQILSF